MRYGFRFSLRTLLIAVLLASVACWYFVNGSVFHKHVLVSIRKANPRSYQDMSVLASRHIWLGRMRVHGMIIHSVQWPGGSLSPTPIRSGVTKSESSWRLMDNRTVQLAGREYSHIRRGVNRAWSSVSLEFVPGKVEVFDSLRPSVYLDLNLKDIDSFVRDDSVQEWSVDALEKWIAERKRRK